MSKKNQSENGARSTKVNPGWIFLPGFHHKSSSLAIEPPKGGINPFGKGGRSLQAAPLGDRARVGRGLLPHYNTSQEEPGGALSGQSAELKGGGELSNRSSWRGWCLEIKSDCLFSNAPRGAWGGRRRAGAGRRKQLELLGLGFPSSSTVSWDLPPTCGCTALDGGSCRAFPLSPG